MAVGVRVLNSVSPSDATGADDLNPSPVFTEQVLLPTGCPAQHRVSTTWFLLLQMKLPGPARHPHLPTFPCSVCAPNSLQLIIQLQPVPLHGKTKISPQCCHERHYMSVGPEAFPHSAAMHWCRFWNEASLAMLGWALGLGSFAKGVGDAHLPSASTPL